MEFVSYSLNLIHSHGYNKMFNSKRTIPSNSEVVSFGGFQSNHMLAVAHLASEFGLPFDYIVNRLPTPLEERRLATVPQDPNSVEECKLDSGSEETRYVNTNYSQAKLHGMKLVTEAEYEMLKKEYIQSSLIIPQGGASKIAAPGIELLAYDIIEWRASQGITKPLAVVLPGGTGTTAFYLNYYLQHLTRDTQVYVTPCAGEKSLRNFLTNLARDSNHSESISLPNILNPNREVAFGACSRQLKSLWCKLRSLGIEFDLLYAPVAWRAMLDNWEEWRDKELLYIHTGGVSGNVSMIARYKKLSAQ